RLETPPLPLHPWGLGTDPRIHDIGVEKARSRKVPARPVLVQPMHDLHVLLRHRLLREAGSFEGFLRVEILADPNHLATLEIHDPGDCRFGYGATLVAASPEVTDGDDSLAKVPDLCL